MAFCIFSEEKAKASPELAGFWSDVLGWTTLENASLYSCSAIRGWRRLNDEKRLSGHPLNIVPDLPSDSDLLCAVESHKMIAKMAAARDNAPVAKIEVEDGVVAMRVTLDVKYSPNGVPAEAIKQLLEDNIQLAIGNGALTGDTAAEVDFYTVTAKILTS